MADFTIYTLWLFNIAMENDPFVDDFPIKTSIYKGFSMAMLNNQIVYTNFLETRIEAAINQHSTQLSPPGIVVLSVGVIIAEPIISGSDKEAIATIDRLHDKHSCRSHGPFLDDFIYMIYH